MKKEVHDQEIFFDNGSRRTVHNVVDISRGTWWHLFTIEGTEYIINPEKVLFVRIEPQDD